MDQLCRTDPAQDRCFFVQEAIEAFRFVSIRESGEVSLPTAGAFTAGILQQKATPGTRYPVRCVGLSFAHTEMGLLPGDDLVAGPDGVGRLAGADEKPRATLLVAATADQPAVVLLR